MLDTLQNETRIEDGKVTMNDIRRKIEAFVNIKDNIKKVYSIVIYHEVFKVVFQCATIEATPNVYGFLLKKCGEFKKKRFCKSC